MRLKQGIAASPISRELNFCGMRRTSYTMDGFCLLYLLLILLMRSGDVETNPGPDTAESTVSDMEFLKLAHAIPPSYYDAVGISLGIPLAQLQAILIQMSNNYSNAFLRVFMKWKVKQQPPHSNRRQLLADALREIDLGGLSDRLLNEPLTPISTGGPSRLLKSQTKPPSAESQTKPLSPKLVELCANDFKFKYRSTLCKIRADPLNPASTVQFKDMYTNLVLLEEHGTKKRVLDYNNMLDLKVNGEFPKRIMVQGEAGAGKSTFCAKIAWDWIEARHFNHFVWVLIVPLREFKQHTIGEIAKSYLAKNNPATVSQITEYIRSNPDKVFIAFDGLDEVSGKIMKTKSCETQPTDHMQLQPSQPSVTPSKACGNSSETGDIGLVEILCSDQLASCPVLVTTRPWRAVEIRSDSDLMKLYTFIRVEGFNRENLSDYIHKYFPKNDDKDKANKLIQFTSENDVISENMAHYPIYVAMLCLMWKELDEQKLKEMKSLKSFSQIFKEMIAFLKEHYAQKMVKKVGSPSLLSYLKTIDELLGPIAKQALNGLLENTLIFGEDDFQICPESKETACRVGILSQEDRITTSMDIHKRNSHVQLPVFFPHKLFQEYMAGVHLASLYESDRNEFNMLIEQVVLPRKEEFRYLLYFTVSQNKSIATHVLNSMLQGLDVGRELPFNVGSASGMRLYTDVGGELSFIVDVAFESQDPDVAALVKDKVSSKGITLFIWDSMTAHTVAGYAFIGPHVVTLQIERECGPTMSLEVAEMICFMPSLKEVILLSAFHHCFFETLARKGKESKVQTVKLEGLHCPTPASSDLLAEALVSMPNLTNLTLGWVLNEEFYSALKAKASSIQVQTVELDGFEYPTPASSHLLAGALCSMPNLTDLTLEGVLNEEFYSALKAKASSMQFQTLKLESLRCSAPASSHDLAEALCSMPNLTDLIFGVHLHEEFYSTLQGKASSIKVQTLKLKGVWLSTPAASLDIAEALCSMPNLSDLTLEMALPEELYSALTAKASSMQGCFPQIKNGNFRFNGGAQDDLNSFLHTLACFESLQRSRDGYSGNIYNTEDVSSEQSRAMYQGTRASTSLVNPVHTNTSVSLDTLPRGLGANIPVLQESQDNALVRQALQQPGTLRNQSGILPVYLENNPLLWNAGPSQPTFMPSNLQSGMSAGYPTPAPYQPYSGYNCSPEYREAYYNPTYHATISSSAPSPNPPVSRHDQPTISAGYLSPTHYPSLVPESTGATRTTMPWSSQGHGTQSYHASTSSSALLCNPPVSRHDQLTMSAGYLSPTQYPQPVPESTGVRHSTNFSSLIQSTSSTGRDHPQHQPTANVHTPRRTLPPSDHPRQQPMDDVNYLRRTFPPSDLPQQQPIDDVPYPRRTLPPSDHPQQQPMGDLNYSRRTLPPSDHPQQQPMGDVHYPRRTLPPSVHPQKQPIGDVHYPRRTLPPSDYPQRQPIGGVHYPRNTLPPSDHPKEHHMGNIHYPRRALPPPDHSQQQPTGNVTDVHYPRRTLPPSDHPHQQPMGDVHTQRRALPPSDHSQQQPMCDVHYPRRTLPPSDHPQQHVGNSPDTVFQFSQTHREGSSSLIRSYKRQATCIQSRVPQGDPEISEKRSKYEV